MIVSFRTVTVEDCKMIREWIKTNRFTRHWYYFDKTPRLSTLENKILKNLKQPKTRANIILIDNVPIGYIQSYPVDGNGNWTKQVKVAENMVSIDYFIGDINYIHKGLGSKMILEYIDQVIKNENYAFAMISPETLKTKYNKGLWKSVVFNI